MKYRVFVEDVGRARFSAFSKDIDASSQLDAIFKATKVVKSSPVGVAWIEGTDRPKVYGQRLIALPVNRQDLWPDGQTGRVPSESLDYWYL